MAGIRLSLTSLVVCFIVKIVGRKKAAWFRAYTTAFNYWFNLAHSRLFRTLFVIGLVACQQLSVIAAARPTIKELIANSDSRHAEDFRSGKSNNLQGVVMIFHPSLSTLDSSSGEKFKNALSTFGIPLTVSEFRKLQRRSKLRQADLAKMDVTPMSDRAGRLP